MPYGEALELDTLLHQGCSMIEMCALQTGGTTDEQYSHRLLNPTLSPTHFLTPFSRKIVPSTLSRAVHCPPIRQPRPSSQPAYQRIRPLLAYH